MGAQSWDETRWEQEYESLLEIARRHLRPEWEFGQVLVVKTSKDQLHVAQIPDVQEPAVRETLENRLVQTLAEVNDTEVFTCLATMNGKEPEIPSWNFRRRLMELNGKNIQTQTFLWGGEEVIYLRSFERLMPPNYTIKKGT